MHCTINTRLIRVLLLWFFRAPPEVVCCSSFELAPQKSCLRLLIAAHNFAIVNLHVIFFHRFLRPLRLLCFYFRVRSVVVVLSCRFPSSCRFECPSNQRTLFPHFTAPAYLPPPPRTQQAAQRHHRTLQNRGRKAPTHFLT